MSCSPEPDPFLWLEEIEGDQALLWVDQQNSLTKAKYASRPSFRTLRTRLQAAYNSDDRIPYVTKHGDHYYNFWQDEQHPRGIWRRTSWNQYLTDDPEWEIVLDLDKLNFDEGTDWAYSGASLRYPDWTRALVFLSRGGSDANVVREFDLESKSFIKDGFSLPESKGSASWAGPDRVFVNRDFGEGSLTHSGYPRTVRLWTRGQSLDEAPTIFEGEVDDVSVSGWALLDEGFERQFVTQGTDFYNSNLFLIDNGDLITVEKPSDANASFHREHMFLDLDSDWELAEGKIHPAGSLLAIEFETFLAGNRNFHVLFEPASNKTLLGYSTMRDAVLLRILEDVRHRLEVASFQEGSWINAALASGDGFQALSIWPVDPREGDAYYLTRSGYTDPPSLHVGHLNAGKKTQTIKRSPSYFDTSDVNVKQHWAVSKDGTRIPYFEVAREVDGNARPTLLYGYGGFQVSMLPSYSATIGAGWLERGGVYVVANIRGGGEFGPKWHQAALKRNRMRAYEDFIAVAEDLIARGVTTSDQLGIQGGSNGGLLMGNMLAMRPKLFGAVVAQVPLFDMKRYHRMLAGASWIAEYGDPDIPSEWRFLRKFSPYQRVRERPDYPQTLIMTSTRDDRVHPGHARKMAAKLAEMRKPVAYYENTEGGHAAAVDNEQRAFMWALSMEFLWDALDPPEE